MTFLHLVEYILPTVLLFTFLSHFFSFSLGARPFALYVSVNSTYSTASFLPSSPLPTPFVRTPPLLRRALELPFFPRLPIFSLVISQNERIWSLPLFFSRSTPARLSNEVFFFCPPPCLLTDLFGVPPFRCLNNKRSTLFVQALEISSPLRP